MVSSSEFKYKLVRHVTFNPLLFWIAPGLISCIFIYYIIFIVLICLTFSVVHFFQGTSVSITLYLFKHYQLWMMDSKTQRVFFAKTPKLYVYHTEVRKCCNFKIGTSCSTVSPKIPKWGGAGLQVKVYDPPNSETLVSKLFLNFPVVNTT